MDFAAFLEEDRNSRNLSNIQDYYDALGGESSLGIKLRYFREVTKGEASPSPDLFARIFAQMPPSRRRPLLIAYLRSTMPATPGEQVVSFAESYLRPAHEGDLTPPPSPQKTSGYRLYDEAQLEFLNRNESAFRFLKKLVLIDFVKVEDSPVREEILKEMRHLELVTVENGLIKPYAHNYVLPNNETGTPKLVGKANDYIMRHADIFGAREGSEDQEISYSMLLVSPESGKRALEETRQSKQWTRSLRSTRRGANGGNHPDDKVLVQVILTRLMKQSEIK